MPMNPFISIITPTLNRDSLVQTCESISSQSFFSWQHIVIVDCEEFNQPLMAKIAHPQRTILRCDHPHRDGGNSCRIEALKYAKGSYCWMVDDDNFVADPDVFRDVANALESAGNPPWSLFPITRLGCLFYTDPPRSCHVDTLNFILRRDIAYWPSTDAYGSDGLVVDDLMARGIPYAAFPDFRPIAVLPKISYCQ